MSPSEDPTSPASGGTNRTDGADALRPMLWIVGAGLALFLTGILIAVLSSESTATSSRLKVGFLLIALGAFVFAGIPGLLEVVGHSWAAAALRTLEERFNHPRLVGLAQLWLCVFVLGWLSILTLLQFPTTLWITTYAVFLAGFGPLFAIWLFGRRQ